MSEEMPSLALQDIANGEEKTAGPLSWAEHVASNLGIERPDENISADRIRSDELIFYRIVKEMVVESKTPRAVALHKLSIYLQMDSSNVDAKSEHDENALHLAVLNDIDEAIPELLKYGADINAESTHKAQSLHFAVYRNNRAIVKFLLDNGADLDVQMETGRTALYVASWLGYTEVVALLLSKCAKATVSDEDDWTTICDNKYGYAPLIAAATWGHRPSNSDGEERPKDEKDHGSDNKKVDRDQRLNLSMDTATVMRSRKSREQKLNMRGGMSHDASWYA